MSPRLVGLFGVIAAVIILLVVVASTSEEIAAPDDIEGIRAGGITFGPDQCPFIELTDLASAMPELGAPNESLASGGAQFVCNFGGTDANTPASLQIIGGSTGKGGQPEWDSWAGSSPGPDRIDEYNINGVPMLIIASTSDGEQIAFPGPDRLVWMVDVTLTDNERSRQVELLLARALALG